jgi:probable F420-dependent oxidoreductase
MKIDGGLAFNDLGSIRDRIRALETAGYDGAVCAEISNDPFLPLAIAAEHSERIDLMTAITVAFARSPMTLAQTAHDLNAFSRGRMVLGLGSQIRPHITKRFSMPWDKPASRMREFILAMRAIWDCWYEDKQLDFRGEFYTHTLMTPMFTPPEKRYGRPRVLLAAVGPRMTEVAAEVADGLIAHAFTTDTYFREVTLPAVERGLAKAGRSREDFEIQCPVWLVAGETEEEVAANAVAARKQIAFYASTPAYRGVLECHGQGDLQTELTRMSKLGQWDEMGTRIDDALLGEIAAVGVWDEAIPKLRARCASGIDRLMCSFSAGSPEKEQARLAALRA